MGLRFNHEDQFSGVNSFIKGKSTANERIEKFWGLMRNHTIEFYIRLFKYMEHVGLLNTANILDIEFLRFCFGPLIKNDLQRCMKEFNEHRLRNQPRINVPSAIPSILFYWPEKYGGYDCQKEYNKISAERLEPVYTKEPKLYNDNTEDLVKILIPDVATPLTSEQAYYLFTELKELVVNNFKELYEKSVYAK